MSGSSPRVYPRPEYPSFLAMVGSMLKEICWQSGVGGTILVTISFAFYTSLVSFLRAHLPKEYNDDAVIFSLLTSIVHTGAYVIINSMFGAMDYFKLFQQYKLHRKAYMQPKVSLVTKTLMEAAFSQLVVNPLAAWYILYPAFTNFGMMSLDDPLPDYKHIFTTMCLANVFNGVFFYTAHRIVHSKALYVYIHKQHHEYAGTMGIAAEYANPVEQVLANMIPTLGGVFLARTHRGLCVCGCTCVCSKPMSHTAVIASSVLGMRIWV